MAKEKKDSPPTEVLVKYLGEEDERRLSGADFGENPAFAEDWLWSREDLHMAIVPADIADQICADDGPTPGQFAKPDENETQRYAAMLESRGNSRSNAEYRAARAEAEAHGIPLGAYDTHITSQANEENASQEPEVEQGLPDPPTPSDTPPAEPEA
jgi:hypothetical protein